MQSLQTWLTRFEAKSFKSHQTSLTHFFVLRTVERNDLKNNFFKIQEYTPEDKHEIGKCPGWIGNTSSNFKWWVFHYHVGFQAGKSKTIKLCQQLPGTPVFNRLSAGTTSPVPRTTMSPRTTVLVVIWTSFLEQTILGNFLPSEIDRLKAQVFLRDSSWSSDVLKDP